MKIKILLVCGMLLGLTGCGTLSKECKEWYAEDMEIYTEKTETLMSMLERDTPPGILFVGSLGKYDTDKRDNMKSCKYGKEDQKKYDETKESFNDFMELSKLKGEASRSKEGLKAYVDYFESLKVKYEK
ncbi:MAG: hypothetical protein RR565_11085 [Erysipelothrix sp.]